MKIIAFGGSNSRHSINKKFAASVASLFGNADVEVLDLNDFPMPLYSVDLEAEVGSPAAVNIFLGKISSADLLVISLAENNSSFNVGFKNIFDWNSRVNAKQFFNKPVLLLSTSPGKRGGASVLAHGKTIFPFHGADIRGVFSLPSFYENFDAQNGIVNIELSSQLKKIVSEVETSLTSA